MIVLEKLGRLIKVKRKIKSIIQPRPKLAKTFISVSIQLVLLFILHSFSRFQTDIFYA